MGAALTGALGGSGGSSESDVQQTSPAVSQQPGGRGSLDDSSAVCRFELNQFIECSQTQHDLSLCQGFSEALKECRRANGEWTELSTEWTKLSTAWTDLSTEWTDLSTEWTDLCTKWTDLCTEWTGLSTAWTDLCTDWIVY